MIVQHNITAMNSNRMLGLTTSAQAKSTEKLSSGYKINRAADDAAGLTISEKMRRQIRGLTQASLNAQDGISCVQTAEGALTEVHDMLQRMDELATKAANGTMTEEDRQAVQDEIDQLIAEIDRVSETTKFNEMDLLKGDGTEMREREISATPMTAVYNTENMDPANITIEKLAGKTTPSADTAWYLEGSDTALAGDDEIIAQLQLDENGNVTTKEGVKLYKKAATPTTDFGAQTVANQVTDAEIREIYGAIKPTLYSDAAGTQEVKEEDLSKYFNEDGTYKTQLYIKKGNTVSAVGDDYIDKYVTVTAATDKSIETYEATKALTFKLHVGSESDPKNKISVDIEAMSAAGIGVAKLAGNGVMTQDDATNAIDTIKDAVSKVSKQRSALGAVQNRLEHTINNLDNIVENTTAAEAQIRDTDIATEMVKYANNNILQQAGTSMLSQANQSNQLALSLLG